MKADNLMSVSVLPSDLVQSGIRLVVQLHMVTTF